MLRRTLLLPLLLTQFGLMVSGEGSHRLVERQNVSVRVIDITVQEQED